MAGLTIYQAFFASLYVAISMYANDYREADRKENFQPKSTYDYIVVGAGTSGSVVASKLCQKYSVLLIDAGGDTPPPNYTPAAFQFLPVIDTESYYTYNWTIRNQKASTSTGGVMPLVQGKGLGGSTVLNAMIYNRGHALDYDKWAAEIGDSSWTYENLKKYFEASEKYEGPTNPGMGSTGPLPVSLIEKTLEGDQHDWLKQWHAAGRELGYESDLQPNPDLKEGFMTVHENKNQGHRITAFDAFVKPLLGKGNLDVLRYGTVLKVNLGARNRATGVVYSKDGKEYTIGAGKEVILSAGTLNTPKILMNSGIGPQLDLRLAGIRVRINLPVGQYLQDHISAILRPSYVKEPFNHFDSQAHKEEFDDQGTGPMSGTQGRFAQAYLRSDLQKGVSNEPHPDLQFMAVYNSSYVHDGDNAIGIRVSLVRPSSVGNVKLNRGDPQGPLIVDPQYLSTERDQVILGQGLKKAFQLFETEEFKKTGAVLDKTPVEECKQYEFGSDEYFRCYGLAFSATVWHPVATARMGPRRDRTAVTDPETLLVWGTQNLRVIDNSVAHSAITAYTNALAYMIGQKGGDLVLKSAENSGDNCFVLLGITYCWPSPIRP